jgi:phosphoesterase RecJ-like protein
MTPDQAERSDRHPDKLTQLAQTLRDWAGPIVLASHESPDGDAFGSALALKRALARLGKHTTLPLVPPRYLAFLAAAGELSEALERLEPDTLVVVLDVEVGRRLVGLPVVGERVDGAALTVVIDHHGTNNGAGDLVWVEPTRAATAHMVKDLISALGVPWDAALATPCLTGIFTDTGGFRFSNTTPEVLRAAGELIACGVAYSELTDRLAWRHPDFFRMLGKVMGTVAFPLGGLVAYAELTEAMRQEIGPTDDDSSDYVGQIRYAEGTVVALFLREEREPNGAPQTKVSVRSRAGVSAQAICVALGGGGHVAAAGATVAADLATTKARALEATRAELVRCGYDVP